MHLACLQLMNAARGRPTARPAAASPARCFPVRPTYNFYCHGSGITAGKGLFACAPKLPIDHRPGSRTREAILARRRAFRAAEVHLQSRHDAVTPSGRSSARLSNFMSVHARRSSPGVSLMPVRF